MTALLAACILIPTAGEAPAGQHLTARDPQHMDSSSLKALLPIMLQQKV
jgi:hypothetical protein